MTEAQLRDEDGDIAHLPLEEALQHFFNDKRQVKLSFDLLNGDRVRILKCKDGSLLPTFWDETRQNWYPRQ